MKKVKKAVVAVAGSGTRLLPATKSMPKEMLPIVDKPSVQLVVEELVEAGIEDIIFVTRWDKKPLEDHFDRSIALEDDLLRNKKEEKYEQVKSVAEMANFVYVRQKGPYGNGTPLLSAASLVDDEPFVYAFGDDLVKSDVSFTKQMVDAYDQSGKLQIGAQEMPEEVLSKYGVAKLKDGAKDIEDIIEKPADGEAPSNLATFGRYVFDQSFIDVLKETPLGKDNELWIVDAIRQYVQRGGNFEVKTIEDGQWMTMGDPLNYLLTTLTYAVDRDDIGDDIKAYMKKLIA